MPQSRRAVVCFVHQTVRRGLTLCATCGLTTAAWGAGMPRPGPWTLVIENAQHRAVTTLVVEFTPQKAPSCLGGDWRQLRVLATSTRDLGFFPSGDPLSYALNGNDLAIGRNEICDNYRQLTGRFGCGGARGDYQAFGLGGSTPRGFFTLTPRTP